MDALRRIVGLRLRSLIRRPEIERDLDDEISYHVEQLAAAHVASGMSAREARAAARRTMGSVEHAKDACRDTWRVRLLDQVRQDLRSAFRAMWRSPGTTMVMLSTLAVGIGAATSIFSLVDGVLLKPPLAAADRIFWVVEKTPRGDLSAVSTLNYLDWKRDATSFATLSSWGFGSVTLTETAAPVPLRATFAGAGYFDTLGLRPEIGRTFDEGEGTPGRDHVAILSHQLWQSRFGGDRGVLGRTIRVRGEPHLVVGVLPAEASRGDWSWTEIWLPQTFDTANRTRDYRSFNVYGRLRPGVTAAQANAEMQAIAARLDRDYPDTNRGWTVAMMPYADILVSPALRQSLYVMLAAVAVVLLIGCVNLANMLLARSLTRQREASIRAALGGGRARLLRQYAIESVLLGVIGGALGVGVATAGVAVMRRALPAFSVPGALPPAAAVTLDGRVLLFALLVSLTTSVVFGIVPALAAIRVNLAQTMNQRAGGQDLSRRSRRGLVVAEIALAFVLLTGAGLMLENFYRLQHVDTGFDGRNVLTASLPLVINQATGDSDARLRYLQQIVERVAAQPGVEDAALTSVLPLQGWGSELPCQPDDDRSTDLAQRPTCFFKMVSPAYFHTLGLDIRRGRALGGDDTAERPRVAVINETLARRTFGDRNPIGARILVPELVTAGRARLGRDVAWEVVGVVADERVSPIKERRESPGLYVPLAQSPTRRPSLVVRTAGDPRAFEPLLRRTVAGVDRDQPLADVRTLEAIRSDSLGSERQRSFLLVTLAAITILLAAIGIYGVTAYSVAQRTRELGVRMAIGATTRQVMALVLRDGLVLAATGMAVGVVIAVAAARLMSGTVADIQPPSLLTLMVPAVLLFAVALVACGVPARRVIAIDPLSALRTE